MSAGAGTEDVLATGAGAESLLEPPPKIFEIILEKKLVIVVVVVVVVLLINFRFDSDEEVGVGVDPPFPLPFPLFPFDELPSPLSLGFGVPSEEFPSREQTTRNEPESITKDVIF